MIGSWAFLNGDLNEYVYMNPPQGYQIKGESSNSGKKLVCKLRESLYGLKQALRQWNVKLIKTLMEYGFTQSKSDHSLFLKKTEGEGKMALLIYVDDVLIGGNDHNEVVKVMNYIGGKSKLRDLGAPRYFLDVEIARSKGGMVFCQRKYTLDLLSAYGVLGAKSTTTPMDAGHKLSKKDGD